MIEYYEDGNRQATLKRLARSSFEVRFTRTNAFKFSNVKQARKLLEELNFKLINDQEQKQKGADNE